MENNKYMTCFKHRTKTSIYPKDKIPIELFYMKNSDKLYKRCQECRDVDKIRHVKKHQDQLEKYNNSVINGNNFIFCVDTCHDNSIYARDKVPIEFFAIENSNVLYKRCKNCRTRNNKGRKERYDVKIENHIKAINNNDEFITCLCKSHNNSLYQRDKVPRELFLKYPNIPNSPLTKNCLPCRNILAKYDADKCKKNKLIAEENGLFYCKGCASTIEHCDRALNVDGSLSSTCVHCKSKEVEKFNYITNLYAHIKYDYIHDYQSCCYLCNNVFIKKDNIIVL